MLTLRPLPPQRRECPNPRTPYCHYYYNLKEDRQIEMRDMETTVKVAWSVMPTCGQIWQGGGELEGGAVRKFTLPDTASKPFDFYNFRKIVILSRFVALSVSLTPKVSLFQEPIKVIERSRLSAE